MKVRKNGLYKFVPAGWELFDSHVPSLEAGTVVRVVTLPGAPPPNTMGQAYIDDLSGEFLGMVSTASLVKLTAAERKEAVL